MQPLRPAPGDPSPDPFMASPQSHLHQGNVFPLPESQAPLTATPGKEPPPDPLPPLPNLTQAIPCVSSEVKNEKVLPPSGGGGPQQPLPIRRGRIVEIWCPGAKGMIRYGWTRIPTGAETLAVRVDGREFRIDLAPQLAVPRGLLRKVSEDGWAKYQRQQLQGVEIIHTIICDPGSPLLKQLRALQEAALVDCVVVLIGEPGVGKTAVAQQMHALSGRTGILHRLNCGSLASLDPSVARSRLLGIGPGHGLANVAPGGCRGLLLEADGASLLFDEVGETPLHVQLDLLPVLEGHPFRVAAGQGGEIQVNLKFYMATSRPLEAMVGREVRPEFYDRIKTLQIRLLPLRERPGDIPVLIRHFSEKYGNKVKFHQDLFIALVWHQWPDNVRGLENLIKVVQQWPSLVRAGSVDLKSLKTVPLRAGLQADLEAAYRDYLAFTQPAQGGQMEKKVIGFIVQHATEVFRQGFGKERSNPTWDWHKFIQLRLGELKRGLRALRVLETDVEEPTDCRQLLAACTNPKLDPRRIIRSAFLALQASGVKMSSALETRRYETFQEFFGLTYDLVRYSGDRHKDS